MGNQQGVDPQDNLVGLARPTSSTAARTPGFFLETRRTLKGQPNPSGEGCEHPVIPRQISRKRGYDEVAYGAQDVYLTGSPSITFWRIVYRRHTSFAQELISQVFNGTVGWGRRVWQERAKAAESTTPVLSKPPWLVDHRYRGSARLLVAGTS